MSKIVWSGWTFRRTRSGSVEITVPVPGPETASGTVEITLTVGVIAPRDWRQITAAMSEGVEA